MAPALPARHGLSQLVARQRPAREDWAWHASGQSFPRDTRPQRPSPPDSSAGYVVLIAWTRTHLGVDWPTDVLAGVAFATTWLCFAFIVRDLLTHAQRPRDRHPAAPGES